MTGNTFDRAPLVCLPQINFPVCLAPMVGLTHYPMRCLIRSYLPEGVHTIWPTEMLSSKRLPNQSEEELDRCIGPNQEKHLVPQLLANEEKFIRPSVEILEERGAEAIDINMGCPVKKALKHNYGVALMGDPDYAWSVVKATVRAASVPVSVKIRVGETQNTQKLLDFGRGLEDSGASWVCLHPRTAAQKRRGKADWEQIQKLRDHLSIPVIGNGDVQTFEDVFSMREQTGCSAVMVGRALVAKPWILSAVYQKLSGSVEEDLAMTPEQEGAAYGMAAGRLLTLFQQHFKEPLGVRQFLFYVKVTSVWLEFGHYYFSKMSAAKSYAELRERHEAFFRRPQSMCQRTDLRY